ncbi:Bug family tripartite tricarboxylate transporter substrate binding protein [Pelagibacterium lacus]|uniref:Tripartite tricarboxylate transporter substrate binding protein n=1 Tax=Pelagibacterium lacus TaxID=2282655 RepID=A0A369W3G1_9HYPH|nr:tripartite tricarboxylate transporter substrate binding protein [Pelagibacterium lacus]RDE07890.1 tripartite tricarboxylate transporter substrate binding protein [Pelagibacterium lacus]
MNKRISLVVAFCMLGGMTASAVAQVNLPCGSARLVVASNPGGNSDAIGRVVAEAVNRNSPAVPLQVVNIGGQATMRGSIEVADARPDGCTLLINHQSLILSHLTAQGPVTYSNLVPVARLTQDYSIVNGASGAPFDDAQSFLDYARAHPEEILTGASLGGTSHISLLLLSELAGIELKYVSYNGLQERITAMLGNHIQLSEADIGVSARYSASGDFKPLIALSEDRIPQLPEIPTARELGYDVVFGLAHGIYLPAETPDEIRDYYANLFEVALSDPQLLAQFEANGTAISFLAPDEYEAALTVEFNAYKLLLENMGMLDMP